MVVFTTEYFLRMFARRHSFCGFVLDKLNLIDLASVLPYWISLVGCFERVNLQFLRILRLARALRVLKLVRLSSEMRIIVAALTLVG